MVLDQPMPPTVENFNLKKSLQALKRERTKLSLYDDTVVYGKKSKIIQANYKNHDLTLLNTRSFE